MPCLAKRDAERVADRRCWRRRSRRDNRRAMVSRAPVSRSCSSATTPPAECFERLKPGAMAQRDRRQRPREALQDRVEPELRADLQMLRAVLAEACCCAAAAARIRANSWPARLVTNTTSSGWSAGNGQLSTASAIPQRRQNSMVRVLTSFIFGVVIAPSLCSMSSQANAAPAEFAGERQADRAAADDQHRDMTHGPRDRVHAILRRPNRNSTCAAARPARRRCRSPRRAAAARAAKQRSAPARRYPPACRSA